MTAAPNSPAVTREAVIDAFDLDQYFGPREIDSLFAAVNRLAASTPGAEGLRLAEMVGSIPVGEYPGKTYAEKLANGRDLLAFLTAPPAAVERGEVAREAAQMLADRGWFPSAGSVPYDVARDLILSALSRDGGKA